MVKSLEEILEEPKSYSDLVKILGMSRGRVKRLIKELRRAGYNIKELKEGDTKYFQIVGKQKVPVDYYITTEDIFAVLSDTHLCSKYAEEEVLEQAYDIIKERGITKVFHAGDITDGFDVYKGQKRDVKVWDALGQVDYTAKVYPKRSGVKTYFITGNHDLKAFDKEGIDVGELLAKKRSDLEYLGKYFARVHLTDNVVMHITHPEGGVPFALSYTAQKYLQSAPPYTYPDILVMGHLHTSFFSKYQGVYVVQAGCFVGTTDYFRRRGIQSTVGFWILEAKYNSEVKSLKLEWIDF